MSKTVEIQIEKSRGLVEGLRRHVREMGERGVTNDEINAMEQAVKELEAVNAEVDSIREQLTPTVAKLKVAMDRVKEAYSEKKKTLKGYYPQERWMDYGVPDKRWHILIEYIQKRIFSPTLYPLKGLFVEGLQVANLEFSPYKASFLSLQSLSPDVAKS